MEVSEILFNRIKTLQDLQTSENTETEEEKRKREEEERKKREQELLNSLQISQEQKEPVEILEKTLPSSEQEKSYVSDTLFNKIKVLEEQEDLDVDYTKLSDKISTTRKIQYGARQEPMIAGSAFRLLKAGVAAISPNETFNEAVKRIESERQEEILKDYPEFRGKKEDLTVISGRMGTAISDPVTFFIPWAKVAKAGKITSMATGAAVASTDAALREKTLYGDVSLGYVGLSAVLGGASSGLGDVVARRLNVKSNPEKVLTIDEKGNKVLQDLKSTDLPMVGPLPKEIQESLKEISEETYTISMPFINSFKDDVGFLGQKYTEKDLVLSEIRKLTDELKSGSNLKKIEDIKQANIIQSNFPFTLDGSLSSAPSRTLKLSQLDVIKKKKELLDYQKQLPVIQKEIDDLLFVKTPKNIANVGFASLIQAQKAGVLEGSIGNNLVRAMLHETVRPLMGAGIGGSIALISSDGSDDDALNNMIITGAVLGFMGKRIENSSYKIKPSVMSAFKDESEKIVRRNWRTYLKQLLAGGNAMKGMAMSPAVQNFTRDTLKIHTTRLAADDVVGDSVESLMQSSQDFYRKTLYDITGLADDATVMAAGRIVQQKDMPSTSKFTFLEKGDLQNKEALKMANKLISLNNSFEKYVSKTGVIYRKQEAYGLTQIIDEEAVKRLGREEAIEILSGSFKIQAKNSHTNPRNITDEKARKIAENYLNKSDAVRRQAIIDSDELEKQISKTVKGAAGKADEGTLISSARFFQNERTLYDQEARASAKKLFIQDPEYTNIQLFENTIPVAEFARRYGPNGQGLKKVVGDIKTYYSKFGDITANNGLKNLVQTDIKQVSDTVNSLFKVHGISSARGGEGLKTTVLALQTLLSTTKLTKVALPSLGDTIQVMNNSGWSAAFNSFILQMRQKGLTASKPSASLAQRTSNDYDGLLGRTFTNRRYNGTLQRELSDFSMSGTTQNQKRLLKLQEKFFETVQLGRITRYAREFAFDAGAFRAFDLGKQTKFSTARKRELSELGLSVANVKYLGKFKSMDEAYADAAGKVFLERAGRKASARDAIIPEFGNRRLFSQSNDPMIKFAGSFLSWAQGKAQQTNGLVRRIEDGDAKLAVLIMASLPMYATIRQAQIGMNPNKKYRDEMGKPFENEENFKKMIGDTVMFSGNVPWWIDKLVQNIRYTQSSAIENIYPIVGLLQDFISGGVDVVTGKPREGGVEIFETVTPFGKELTRREEVGEAIGLDSSIYEEAKIQDKDIIARPTYATGGLVKGKDDVPYTKENPADRVDPNTGKPYSDQMARLGLSRGGVSKAIEKVKENLREMFIQKQKLWEGDHGDTPMLSPDEREVNLPEEEKTYDIGYGHKIKKEEMKEGLIHGITFRNKDTGEYIPLTEEQKTIIQKNDIKENVQVARNVGWDNKLKERGLTWETLEEPVQLVLEDLAYNVGGTKAGKQWNKIFDDIQKNNIKGVVGNLRRTEAGVNTEAMDNRAAKAAYNAGLINNLQEAIDYGLPLATSTEIPST